MADLILNIIHIDYIYPQQVQQVVQKTSFFHSVWAIFSCCAICKQEFC